MSASYESLCFPLKAATMRCAYLVKLSLSFFFRFSVKNPFQYSLLIAHSGFFYLSEINVAVSFKLKLVLNLANNQLKMEKDRAS